jgi:hypothetical protein
MARITFDWGMFFFVAIIILAFFPWFTMLADVIWWMLSERHLLNIYEVGNELRLKFYIGYPFFWIVFGAIISCFQAGL